MTQLEKKEYKKAYAELLEIIKLLPKEEQNKIPDTFKKNLEDNIDKNYIFVLDKEKDILEQEYKDETKALFVELYERYLATEDEEEFWRKYDKICFNMINAEKQKKYNSAEVLKNNQTNKNDEHMIIEYKKSVFVRILNKIKKIFDK